MPAWAKRGSSVSRPGNGWEWDRAGLGRGADLGRRPDQAALENGAGDEDAPQNYSLADPARGHVRGWLALPTLLGILRIGDAQRILLSYAGTLTTFLADAWLCVVGGAF